MLQCDTEPLTGDQTLAASSKDSAVFSAVWKYVNATVATKQLVRLRGLFACGGKTSACIRTSSTKQARGDKENLYSALRSAFCELLSTPFMCEPCDSSRQVGSVSWLAKPPAGVSPLSCKTLIFYFIVVVVMLRHNAMGVLRGGGSGVCCGPLYNHTL